MHRALQTGLFLLALIVATALAAGSVIAQDADIRAQIKDALDATDRLLRAPEAGDDALVAQRLALEDGLGAAREDLVARDAEIAEITGRLTELGDAAPGEGPQAQAERERLSAERADLLATRGALADLEARAVEAIETVAERRRRAFSEALFARRDLATLLSPETWRTASREGDALTATLADWAVTQWRVRPRAVLTAGLVILGGALAALALTARLRPVLAPSLTAGERPTYLGRVSRGLGAILVRTVGVALLAFLIYAALEVLGLLTVEVRPLLLATLSVLVGTQFALAVLQTILSPGRAHWRLLDVSDRAARRLAWLGSAVIAVFAIDILLDRIARIASASLDVTLMQNFVAAIVIGLLLIAIALVRPGHGGSHDEADAASRDTTRDTTRDTWPPLVRWPLLLLGAAILVMPLLGFVALAQFVALQVVITGAILATMWIGISTARAISAEGALKESVLGRRIAGRRQIKEERFDQFGVAISLALGAIVLLIGVPLILLQWGFRAEEIGAWLLASARGIQVGSVTISLTSILLALGVLALGLLGTRALQRWLDGAVLERGRVDAGVRHSIRTIVGYVGLVIVVLFALSIAGVNFASLAFVAGALSVGIGFGLQNVVSNFVSGLILLAERPFRVGDIVETGTTLGVIKKISVRSTTIETFNKQAVIVPNSDLINGVVSNWTLDDRNTRADIPVGVAYDSDPRRVEALLIEVATSHPLVMTDPAPFVLFNGFGDSSLNFELRVYLANLSDRIATANELSYRILDGLRAEDIEIPFPQRDVNLRGAVDVTDVVNAQGSAAAEPAIDLDPR